MGLPMNAAQSSTIKALYRPKSLPAQTFFFFFPAGRRALQTKRARHHRPPMVLGKGAWLPTDVHKEKKVGAIFCALWQFAQ